MSAKDEINNGHGEIGPADQTENAVPTRADGKWIQAEDVLIFSANESQRQINEDHDSNSAENEGDDMKNAGALGRCSFARWRDGAEREDGRGKHQGHPQRAGPAKFFGIGTFVDHQNAEREERDGSNEDVQKSFPGRLALVQARAEGEGDRHANDEQKAGEYQVHESHSAAAAMTVAEMDHPIGNEPLRSARKVVHKNHGEHDEATQGINGGDARSAAAKMASWGFQQSRMWEWSGVRAT